MSRALRFWYVPTGHFHFRSLGRSMRAARTSLNCSRSSVQAQLRAVTDLTEFRLRPEVHATYFPDNHNQDGTDSFLNINWNQNGQRYQGDPSIEDPNGLL
jgi:hypothetical protein